MNGAEHYRSGGLVLRARAEPGTVSARLAVLLAVFLEVGTDGVGPDLIALGGRMQEVGHDVAFEDAGRGQELRAEVFIEDGPVVREALDDLVRGGDLRAVLVVGGVARGEDAEEQDLRVRGFSWIALTQRRMPSAVAIGPP